MKRKEEVLICYLAKSRSTMLWKKMGILEIEYLMLKVSNFTEEAL